MITPNKAELLDWASYLALAILIFEVLYRKLRDLIIIVWIDFGRIPPSILQRLFWLITAVCFGGIVHAFWNGLG